MKTRNIILQTSLAVFGIAVGLYSIFFMWKEHPSYSLFLLFGVFLILSMWDRIRRDKTKETLLQQTVIKKPKSQHINIGYQCYSHDPEHSPIENEYFTEYLLHEDKTYIIRVFEVKKKKVIEKCLIK